MFEIIEQSNYERYNVIIIFLLKYHSRIIEILILRNFYAEEVRKSE